MTIAQARPLYVQSLKERGISVDKEAIDVLRPIYYHARLLTYRDYLMEQQAELEKKMIEKALQDTQSYEQLKANQKDESTLPKTKKEINVETADFLENQIKEEDGQVTQDIENKDEQNEQKLNKIHSSVNDQVDLTMDDEMDVAMEDPVAENSADEIEKPNEVTPRNDTPSTDEKMDGEQTDNENKISENESKTPRSGQEMEENSPSQPDQNQVIESETNTNDQNDLHSDKNTENKVTSNPSSSTKQGSPKSK